MTLKEAIVTRHMVRSYLDTPLPLDVIEKLQKRVEENNLRHKLSIRLMTDDTTAYPGIVKLVMAKGIKNYLIMAGDPTEDLDVRLGYAGADLMLYAQTIGLNTWWASGVFSRSSTKASVGKGKSVRGVVAVGYGTTQGVQHKMKTPKDVSHYDGADTPHWFMDGVNAALHAPTALNKLNFFIEGNADKVKITYKKASYSEVDRGLVMYHFEVGAGKDNFEFC